MPNKEFVGPPPPSVPARAFIFCSILGLALYLTGLATQTWALSVTTITVVATTYVTYGVTTLAIALHHTFSNPALRRCMQHWRCRPSRLIVWIARVSTLLCPTIPCIILDAILNGPHAPTYAYAVAAAITTAIVAVYLTRRYDRDQDAALQQHLAYCSFQQPDLPTDPVPGTARDPDAPITGQIIRSD